MTEIPADDADSYVCECGNRTDTDGFYAVDPDGYWTEPVVGWDGTYVRRLRTAQPHQATGRTP